MAMVETPDDLVSWMYDILTHHHNLLERLRERSKLKGIDAAESISLAQMYDAATQKMKAERIRNSIAQEPE
jgi:hypothetical protein